MLSRTAERVYWLARYVERLEDVARLINAHWQGVMDMPSGDVGPQWDVLVRAIDAERAFANRYSVASERNVMKFMVADEDNAGSLYSSARAVRENVRTTREVVPPDVWETVNELQIEVEERAPEALTRKRRFEFIESVLAHCHLINGLIEGALSRGLAYQFYRSGRAIERADMATRILDATSEALRLRPVDDPFGAMRWMHVLRALNALPVYRQGQGPQVTAEAVTEFLLRDEHCPRSVAFCLDELARTLPRIPAGEGLKSAVRRVRRRLIRSTAQDLSPDRLHDTLDRLQLSLYRLDTRIRYQFFEAQ